MSTNTNTNTRHYVIEQKGTGAIMWAGAAASHVDALRRFYAEIGHPEHSQERIIAMSDDEVEDDASGWLRWVEVPAALYQMMGGDKLDGTRESTLEMLADYEAGLPVVGGPADVHPDFRDCAHVDVVAFGRRFTLQISRPRHPSRIGESLESGAAILTGEGHDDNADFERACEAAGQDFQEVADYVIERSDAERALDEAAERAASEARGQLADDEL